MTRVFNKKKFCNILKRQRTVISLIQFWGDQGMNGIGGFEISIDGQF